MSEKSFTGKLRWVYRYGGNPFHPYTEKVLQQEVRSDWNGLDYVYSWIDVPVEIEKPI